MPLFIPPEVFTMFHHSCSFVSALLFPVIVFSHCILSLNVMLTEQDADRKQGRFAPFSLTKCV